MEPSQPTQHSQQATQPATQPFLDPRRQARTLSELSENDAADIICILHANSDSAARAVRATMLSSPEHILQNEDLVGLTVKDLEIFPEIRMRTRDIALRMSSTVNFPRDGFRFGRNAQSCDVLLTNSATDKLVSNVHFKIYVHEQGSLMLQDCSTNGTLLDDEALRSKDRRGRTLSKPARRTLKHGSMITIMTGQPGQEIKFMVRFPNRADYEDLYDCKLRNYLKARGVVPKFFSLRESSFGNWWNGGSIYNFTGLLGSGAFATVYRVQTKDEGTIYAAKEIDKKKYIKNGVLDLKFDNELKIMQNLRHPNIVDYIDFHAIDQHVYIIMEYVPCGELSKELAKRGPLPEPEMQQITKQTLKALEYLHRQGVTHRDIKPDNILIASRDPIRIKLTDFGLSKSIVDQETFLKTFCGTLLYCAPEVYPGYGNYAQPAAKRTRRGNPTSKTAPYDSSADMWSFGAVIFHLLAGQPPILGRGENQGAQMLENIMTKDVDFAPLFAQNASIDAVDFISALLNRQPSSRPKESECLNHPWLRDVPDVCDYSGVSDVDVRLRHQLEDVQEDDEDASELDLIGEFPAPVTSSTLPKQDANNPAVASPPRPMKKPKMIRAESTIPQEILYPELEKNTEAGPSNAQSEKTPRLFGELTPSVLQSSGLFGIPRSADQTNPQGGDVPQISSQLEQVSMNDFARRTVNEAPTVHGTRTLGLPGNHPSRYAESAASLLGAEAQMGQMNMGSVKEIDMINEEPQYADAQASSPGKRNAEGDVTEGNVRHTGMFQANLPLQPRHIDASLLTDEVAFTAQQRLRQNAREENAKLKAQTFHAPYALLGQTLPTTAQTFDHATAAHTPARSEGDASETSNVTDVLRQMNTNVLSGPLCTYGRLVPIEGSFDADVIQLSARSTLWGRAPHCNSQYRDSKDARVPKVGMKIVFFAPGVEVLESSGGDWTQAARIRTIIATSATRGIRINGIKLVQESDDGKAALFGNLYNGDIVTIVDSEAAGSYLKYKVEITFGQGAQARPDSETPFVVRKEFKHHAKMKEQSVHFASHENKSIPSAPPAGSEIQVA